MKKFLVLYRAPISAREQMAKATPEQAKAGMDAWMGWAKRSESVDALDKVLQGHAHLMMPGGSIEIREFLPMPGT
jgi:hypothetical protein